MEVRLNEMSLICLKPARFENEGLLSLDVRSYGLTDRNEPTRINYFYLLRRLLLSYAFVFE